MKLRSLMVFILCFVLCVGCAQENYICMVPNPENDEIVSLDFWHCNSLDELYEQSEYVVIGKFQNKAPTAYNMARDLFDPEQESDEVYIEGLVYEFDISGVLKGEIEENTIPISLCHGMGVEENGATTISRAETFLTPDAETYKILFLIRENYTDNYAYTSLAVQLTSGGMRSVLESAEFEVQSAIEEVSESFVLSEGKSALSFDEMCSQLNVTVSETTIK